MARDAAELKEVLRSVSNILKPFYAQVIFSALQPPFFGDRGRHGMQTLGQQGGEKTERSRHLEQGLL